MARVLFTPPTPHSYLLGRLLVEGELVFLGGPVKTYEAGIGGYRAWALKLTSGYISEIDLTVLEQSMEVILFRQKKLRITCRLYASLTAPYGLAHQIFPVFEDLGVMMENHGFGILTGPVIASEYLSRFLKGRFGYYERCERNAPSSDFHAMQLIGKTE